MERVWFTSTSIEMTNDVEVTLYQAHLHGYSHLVCDPRYPSHKWKSI